MASQGASDVQTLTQKAETFWSEIKDLKIPDVTSGKKKGKIYNLGKIFTKDTSIDQTEKTNRESEKKQIAFDDPSTGAQSLNFLSRKKTFGAMEINLKGMFYGDVTAISCEEMSSE